MLALLAIVLLHGANAQPTFNKANSYRFVYYAYAAYNQPKVGTWNCPYCTNYTVGFNVTKECSDTAAGSYAYVGYNPNYKEIVASFRGSSNIPNWIEDIDAIKTPPGVAFPGIPSAQVEDGFYTYYKSLSDCVLAEMKSLQSAHAGYQLATTGHSLGAAGSALCAMDMLLNHGYSNVQCLNFGEPRLGNKAFSQASLQHLPGLQRMVDYKDCVPKLPLQSFGYQHEPYEIYEHPTGADVYQVCTDSSGEDPKCSDSVGSDCNDHLHYMGVTCCDHP